MSRLEGVLAVESNLIIIDALTLGVGPDRQEDAFACECRLYYVFVVCVCLIGPVTRVWYFLSYCRCVMEVYFVIYH